MDENQDKLDHLHGSEVPFPPKIFLDGGAAGCQEVVEVHHHVDSRVQEGTEATLTSSDKPRAPPAEEGEGAMVDHMEGGQVGELLTGNKEHRVSQVNKLGEVVPPSEVEGPLSQGTCSIVNRLADPIVFSCHVETPAL